MLLKETEIGKRVVSALARKKIINTQQLSQFFPKKYHDYRNIVPIQQAQDYAAVRGILYKLDLRNVNNKKFISASILQEDGTWINTAFFSDVYRYDEYYLMLRHNVILCGMVNYDQYGYSIKSPELMCREEDFIPQILPVYTKITGVSTEYLRTILNTVINDQEEVLPADMVKELNLSGLKTALRQLHWPETREDIEGGSHRILVNDLLYFAVALELNNQGGKTDTNFVFTKNQMTGDFTHGLPFLLTEDQKSALTRFYLNANAGKRNNILLQGDVGCGKTIVAVCMMMIAAENGFQSVLMAPRTVLARQHYEEIEKYAETCGIEAVFLYSGMKSREKKEKYKKIADGTAKFIIGTHSCIANDLQYHNLGLIVTDEEHLFGVRQKEALVEKAKTGVHAVSMSATPIPRSLALVLYGEQKEILVIKTMPKGRLPVKTGIVHDHERTFPFMEQEIRAGHQCYVVCPAIEESENEEVNLVAIETIEGWYRSYFEPKGIKIGVVHGKMKEEEIREVIHQFAENECQILISTTVIEVGVNVPNATVMVIEQADRFGLATLHQLRGRVGRSSLQSYCVLVAEEEKERLLVMTRTTDGFEIATADLMQRGSGNLIGQAQSGMNTLVNKMLKHSILYESLRKYAKKLIEENDYDRLIDFYSTE